MRTLLIIFLLFTSTVQAQLVSGAAKEEGRTIVSKSPFIQEGTIDGWAEYELAIDRNGNVTGAKIIATNLTRTSAKAQIRNYVMTMKFTAGTIYPAFHHAVVKVTLVKSANPKIETQEINLID